MNEFHILVLLENSVSEIQRMSTTKENSQDIAAHHARTPNRPALSDRVLS
jgi:hypothetical protein